MRIDVWSDIACPWCYLGKHRLDAALAKFGGEHRVEYHAFELAPRAPKAYDDGLSHAARIANKFGRAPEQIEAMHAQMGALGREVDLDFQFERVRGGNTFDAHRVVRLGLERGVQAAVKERLLKAYFSDGEPIGDAEALARLGGEAGLDAAEVRTLLAGDRLTAEVRADEAAAEQIGITGVPFFLLAEQLAVPGAQSVDVMVQALAQARDLGK